MPRTPSTFPFMGRLRRLAITLLLRELKPGGTDPWGQRYIHPTRTVQHATRPAEMWLKHWRVTPRGKTSMPHICHCLPPDRTRPKVNDSKDDYSGGLGEGKVGHDPKLEPCWTMMLLVHPKVAQPKRGGLTASSLPLLDGAGLHELTIMPSDSCSEPCLTEW